MSEKSVPIASEQATQPASGKRYSDDFKRDAIRLITEQRYTFAAAATAVGVSEKSPRDWKRTAKGEELRRTVYADHIHMAKEAGVNGNIARQPMVRLLRHMSAMPE